MIKGLTSHYWINIFLGVIVSMGVAGCNLSPSILVVRVNGSEAIPSLSFDSIHYVNRLDEPILRAAAHLLIQSPVTSLDFRERSIVERYLEAGGQVSFTCRDTIYNWGQLVPYFESGKTSIRCDENPNDFPTSRPDYDNLFTEIRPSAGRLVREVLVAPLREPIALVVTENSLVYWIERKGTINTYNPATGEAKEIDSLDVYTGEEDGLLGIALDPDFQENQWVYLFYSPPGDIPKQHVSRFCLSPEGLDKSSEKVIMEIPTQREECCHSAGDLEFDRHGNLYISTGDNTFSRASDGFTPLDERPGRSAFDSQKSSPNTNDLRGKILRIHPEKDGTYTIPDGNLFPKDGSEGLPEIYIMGARNPFTIAIHPDNDWLYWGDVGPDGNVTSERGPTAHDEINFAKKPGNYGWPYFNANNLAYADYDFETGEIGARFDPEHPINTSVNNTGRKELPPAVPAMVYYSFSETEQFPGVGKGSRSVGVGEVYSYRNTRKHGYQFPEYFNGKLLVFDWARDWIKVVSQDDEGNFQSIEPFLDHSVLASPIDMTFGADGALYVLEYGIGYFTDNHDSKLIRLEYVNGNRPPQAVIEVSDLNGQLPLKITLSGELSSDPDPGDRLSFQWSVFGPESFEILGTTAQVELNKAGIYTARLRVFDDAGDFSQNEIQLVAGNSAPVVSVHFEGNQTFYQPGRPVYYWVEVTDTEDGSIGKGIDSDDVTVQLSRYEGSDNRAPASLALLDDMKSEGLPPGLQLIQKSDCKSCHKLNEKSIGPSFYQIADKYDKDYIAIDLLSKKVREGGGGVWGDGMMIAHPDISMEAAREIVKYIFTVNDPQDEESEVIPVSGTVITKAGSEQKIRVEAMYQDRGGEAPSLSARAEKTLRPPVLQVELADLWEGFEIRGEIEEGDRRYLEQIEPDAEFTFNNVDLTNVSSIEISYFLDGEGSVDVEVVIDGAKKIASAQLSTGQDTNRKLIEIESEGIHNLRFRFTNPSAQRLGIDQLSFHLNPKSS